MAERSTTHGAKGIAVASHEHEAERPESEEMEIKSA